MDGCAKQTIPHAYPTAVIVGEYVTAFPDAMFVFRPPLIWVFDAPDPPDAFVSAPNVAGVPPCVTVAPTSAHPTAP